MHGTKSSQTRVCARTHTHTQDSFVILRRITYIVLRRRPDRQRGEGSTTKRYRTQLQERKTNQNPLAWKLSGPQGQASANAAMPAPSCPPPLSTPATQAHPWPLPAAPGPLHVPVSPARWSPAQSRVDFLTSCSSLGRPLRHLFLPSLQTTLNFTFRAMSTQANIFCRSGRSSAEHVPFWTVHSVMRATASAKSSTPWQ